MRNSILLSNGSDIRFLGTIAPRPATGYLVHP